MECLLFLYYDASSPLSAERAPLNSLPRIVTASGENSFTPLRLRLLGEKHLDVLAFSGKCLHARSR